MSFTYKNRTSRLNKICKNSKLKKYSDLISIGHVNKKYFSYLQNTSKNLLHACILGSSKKVLVEPEFSKVVSEIKKNKPDNITHNGLVVPRKEISLEYSLFIKSVFCLLEHLELDKFIDYFVSPPQLRIKLGDKSKNFNNVKKKFNIISKLGDLEESSNSIFTFDKFNFTFNKGTVIDMVLVLTGKVDEKKFNSLIKIIISNINQNPNLGELKTIDDSTIKTIGFDIKYLNNNKYIYTYYSVKNNKIINLKYRIYDFSTNGFETENKIDITNNNIPDYNTFNPSISFINTNKDYIISYIREENSKKKIIYFSNKNTDNKIKFDYDNSNNVILLELKNYLNEYTNTLLLFNSIKNDNYEKESILMKEIESVKDFININNNLKITNKGSSIIKNIVIKNDNINSLSELKKIVGENGEIKIMDNDLYIYLDDKWKKINLTDV